MICCTSRASRSLSVCIRPANRCTASGSSAASMTASESSWIAPTGVFSSWLTLATKSRRIDSTRRSRVRSSTSASTSWELSGATRAVTWRGGRPCALHEQLGLADLPVAAYLPDQLGELAHGDLVAADQAHRDGRRGGLEHRVAGVDDQRAAAQHGEHGGHAGRQGRLGHLRRAQLALADPEGEDGAAAQHGAEQREEQGLDRRAHAIDRTQGFTRVFAFADCAFPGLFTARSRNDANPSPGRRTVRSSCVMPTPTSSTRSATTS